MKTAFSSRWVAPLLGGALLFCVLGLYERTIAQTRETKPPFANAVDLQVQVIDQLKELNGLLKEQNALLKSGTLQVVIAEKKPKR